MANSDILIGIKEVTGFSDKELEIVLQRFKAENFKKKTNLLSAGKTAKEVYFILSGCMRLFYEKDGEDISAFFFTEGMFAGAYDSFISQKPSRHSIEVIEECQVLTISFKDLQDLFIEFPKMNEFVRKVLEERFVELHQLFTSYILDSPEERYLNLLTHRPDLLNRIPQHQIATFLGITPVSLSRIRNRVMKK
ncbi:Crp/Fnr family transcriptional regulator [Runella sp.]|jgi:CRP-like cAMP-binding protein|uniref:Crp/Fnr family transcriptional regulator n=1 Tax=Runella sp. TaxID=1960881 RepID=UPI00260D0AED|nr:Crp/Fnr family transcriptional regulator [Runella sp.]